jgi:heptosyltransferase-2
MEFERILVRATNWVGDAVMSVPALQALRSRFPRAHIAILAKTWVADLYGREPFCNELIPYTVGPGFRGGVQRLSLAGRLNRRSFDAAIVLPNSFDSAAVIWAARIPRRIGYQTDSRGWLLTDRIPMPRRGEVPVHQRFHYLELLKRSGLIDSYPLDGSIGLSGARVLCQNGEKRFEELSIRLPVVGVSPGAAYGGAKRWLPERFADAAIKIARESGATVAIFGAPEEVDICARVHSLVEAGGIQCLNFAGKTTLGSFMELAAACDTYLTNDSGPMHIATALGVPTVVTFGPTDEKATGPTGDRFQIIREPVDCSPCLLRECPIDHRCMTRIESRRVADAALTMRAAVHK